MVITEALEMYLVTIFKLSKKGYVRSIRVAEAMNISRSSASVTIRNLEKEKLVKISPEGFITLEPEGLNIAERICNLHSVLFQMLTKIGVPEDIADKDACKLEHDISKETYNCIQKYLSVHL